MADVEASQRNGYEFSSCKKYPVEVLIQELGKLPKDVDPSHREVSRVGRNVASQSKTGTGI